MNTVSEQEIRTAVRELRNAFDESQEQFASRLGIAVRTISRYETTLAPKAGALLRLWELAREKKLETCAAIFEAAMRAEISVFLESSGFLKHLGDQVQQQVIPELENRFRLRISAQSVDAHLTDDEIAILSTVLQVLRTAEPSTRSAVMEAWQDPETAVLVVRRSLLCQQFVQNAQAISAADAYPIVDSPPGNPVTDASGACEKPAAGTGGRKV